MKFKNVILLLFTITIAVLLSFVLHFRNQSTTLQNTNRFLSNQIAIMSIKETSFDANKAMTGLQAPDVVGVTRNNEEIHLSDLLNNNPILIYRYTQVGGCRPCYEAQIQLMQEVFKEIPYRAVILATYNSHRDFLISVRNQALDIVVLHIPADAFDWAFEQSGTPYYFVLHPCMRISNIYVPNERDVEGSRRYLEGVNRLLL